MNEMEKYYQILGLKPGTSEKEVLEAYKVLVKVWHPDRFSDDPQVKNIATEKIKEIDEAFKQLMVWTGSRQEKGKAILEPPLEVKLDPPITKEGIDKKADPQKGLIPEASNASVESKEEGPVLEKPWKDTYVGMEFVFVKGGSFQMGDVFGDGYDDEKPVHEVTVGDFWIGKYPVTQGHWKKVMGNNPSHFKSGNNYPVENVSWNDVQEFIQKLNEKTGKRYRLPTEAEWEYAARSGGKKEKWSGTSSASKVGNYAWFDKNSYQQTHPVGQKKPNSLGLYDMSGNVWEWCEDWYVDSYYENSPRFNPKGPLSGEYRVIRGGSWYDPPWYFMASYRKWSEPSHRHDYILGFRLVLPTPKVQSFETQKQKASGSGIDSHSARPYSPQDHKHPTDSAISEKAPSHYVPSSTPPPNSNFTGRIEQDVVSASVVEFAGFWKRVGASIIDSIVLSLLFILAPFIYLISIEDLGDGGIEKIAATIEATWMIIGIIGSWLYYAVMESSSKQGTLGKMAIGIKVTDIEGNRIGFGRATGRHFGKTISFLILSIGYIMTAFTKKKQGLHDMMAGCLVVVK